MVGVQTVTGIKSPEDLGFSQCHEHIFIRKSKSYEVNPVLCMDLEDKSREELEIYRENGGNTIVDAQPTGCGRSAETLNRLSLQSGVNIIASTGFHKELFYPAGHWLFTSDAAQLTGLFLQELTSGMYEDGDTAPPEKATNIRAGIIKIALDETKKAQAYTRLMAGVRDAAKHWPGPILIHVENQSDPFGLLQEFIAAGIDPKRLLFCHMDRAIPDLEIHKKIGKEGAFLEYDTIGRFKYHRDSREKEIIAEIVDAGLEKQLLLSLDTTRSRLKSYGGEIGLSYLLQVFIPYLKGQGFPQSLIDQFCVENPKRALSCL